MAPHFPYSPRMNLQPESISAFCLLHFSYSYWFVPFEIHICWVDAEPPGTSVDLFPSVSSVALSVPFAEPVPCR